MDHDKTEASAEPGRWPDFPFLGEWVPGSSQMADYPFPLNQAAEHLDRANTPRRRVTRSLLLDLSCSFISVFPW